MEQLFQNNDFIKLNKKLKNQLWSLTISDKASVDDIKQCSKVIHHLRKAGNASYPEENYILVTSLIIKINTTENLSFSEINELLIAILNLRELPEIVI
jgi:hypothetical protein|nr:MAG TPA: hypothetical protein [Caudoviricetes sp.]